ncbi:MAG TPA: rhomboid family intramembrane serine protease [Candidatus Bathyarchaeia archaeon]|nr:rhomboid family intramembrane serine protease [Candidatus Bathyarchaeia archaeon]
MIPIRDHNPSGSFPFINYFLIGINVLVFIYTLTLSEQMLMAFFEKYAIIPALVIKGQHLFSLVSAMFLHGGIGHILGNMLFLNIFGDNLEDRLGHLKYLFFYLICGLAAAVLQIFVDPSSTVPNLGASGAIAGIMGGYLVLFPRNKIDILFSFGWSLRQTTVPAYFMLFYWFVAQLFTGVGSLAYQGEMMGGVAYFAHIGGFLAGWILVRLGSR